MNLASTFNYEAKVILAKCLAYHSHAIFTSPALRCISLAKKFERRFTLDSRLAELSFGFWEAKSWNEIDQASLDIWMDNFVANKVPGGESYLELQYRLLEFIEAKKMASEKNIILITHAGPIRAIIASLLQISLYNSFNLKVNYGSVFRLELAEGCQPVLTYL